MYNNKEAFMAYAWLAKATRSHSETLETHWKGRIQVLLLYHSGKREHLDNPEPGFQKIV